MGLQMKGDGTKVDTEMSAPGASGSHRVVAGGNVEADLSAVVLWVRDEINALRTLGLIGLGARSVEDVAAAIEAKKRP